MVMGELLVYQWLRRQSLVCPSTFSNISSETTQIPYGDYLGRGNETLFKLSWSNDQDGHHAHILW